MLGYYFTPLQYALENLERKRLKISLINELNDPYELFGADLTNDRLRAGYVPMRKHMAATKGVICFCADWELPIMWSHYADRHRGVALGFQLSGSFVFPMRYEERRVVFTEADLQKADAEELMMKLLCTKHDAWRYERELRYFCELKDQERGIYFHGFDGELQLREVIAGVRCNPARFARLRRLAEQAGAKFFRTSLSDSAFQILRQ